MEQHSEADGLDTFAMPEDTITLRIPKRPFFRVVDGKRERVPDEEVPDEHCFIIEVDLMSVHDLQAVESLIVNKLPVLRKAFAGPRVIKDEDGEAHVVQPAPGDLPRLINEDDLRRLTKYAEKVSRLYNGQDERGIDRWIRLSNKGAVDEAFKGKMLAYNRWVLGALRHSLSDFFDSAGFGESTGLDVSAMIARLKSSAAK